MNNAQFLSSCVWVCARHSAEAEKYIRTSSEEAKKKSCSQNKDKHITCGSKQFDKSSVSAGERRRQTQPSVLRDTLARDQSSRSRFPHQFLPLSVRLTASINYLD